MNDENDGKVASGVGGMVWAAMLNASQSNLTIRELAQHRYTLARMFDVLYAERSQYPMNHVLYLRLSECLAQLTKELGAIDSEMCFKASCDLEMREDKLDDEDIPF